MGEVEAARLKSFCDKVTNDPDLLAEDVYGKKIALDASPRPKEYKTFCNIQVQRIFRALGYENLDGLMANEIADYCEKNWISALEGEAHRAAGLGDLVIACWKNPDPLKHGHVAVVYPAAMMIYSGKWGRYVPFVASVDRVVPCGANYAFAEKPKYYRLGRTIA